MDLYERLAIRPAICPPTWPLARIKDLAMGSFLCDSPLYLGSHWRLGRSFPCTTTLLEECRWCGSSERRDHAYIGVSLNCGSSPSRRVIIELSAATFIDINFQYGQRFVAKRKHKRGNVEIEISERPLDAKAPAAKIEQFSMVRTLMKVYGLPDPYCYDNERNWILDVQTRVNHPEYTPAKSQEKASQV